MEYNLKCIMGCPSRRGVYIHSFPKEGTRRAEWCRILGVFPRTKKVYICTAHFNDCYIFGTRLSKYAVPNPPDSRRLNPLDKLNCQTEDKQQDIPEPVLPPEVEKESIVYTENDEQSINIPQEPDENFGKVENFEIRKGSTSDMIIKGRFVKTNDHLIISYTPPRKWSLQQQVKLLDEKCTQQLTRNKQLSQENCLLSKELKKHEKLLPKLRYMQDTIRFLYGMLKLKNQHRLKRLQKREKEKTKKNLKGTESDVL